MMKEQLEKFMDWLWLNHNILTDADKNKVALEQYLTSENGRQALSLFSVVFSGAEVCDLYKKECMGSFCSVTPFPDKCEHLKKQT